jgi:hypothetical protein
MKQYRITSEHFVPHGETGDDNAVMHPDDLSEIKRLAGIPDIVQEDGGVLAGIAATPRASEEGIQSPVGSNISYTANERRELEKEYAAQPGTDLWFIINFTRPYLNGSLRAHVEDYLKKHPEYRPRPHPGD